MKAEQNNVLSHSHGNVPDILPHSAFDRPEIFHGIVYNLQILDTIIWRK